MGVVALTPVVSLGGSKLPGDWQAALVELRVEMQYQVPSRVTLRFSDPGYKLLASQLAKLGAKVTVADPAQGGTSFVNAEVTAVSAEQRPGEQPELLVVALDLSHRMGRATKIKAYTDSSYSDIVMKIVHDAGLDPWVDNTGAQIDYVMQAGSDLAFLSEIAHRTGFDWWVSGNDLHFAKPTKGADVDLTLGEQLRTFSARVSGFQPGSVAVDGWDRTSQKKVSSKANTAVAPLASSKLADLTKGVSSFGHTEVFTGGLGAQTNAESQMLAQSILDRALTAAVTAKGVADGNGKIVLGVTAKIDGAGPLNGSYPVTAVEHVYRPASGFVTRFSSGERRPTTLVDSLGGAAGGMNGPYTGAAHFRSGVTVGVVTTNKDPENLGRVRVLFPGADTTSQTGWARVVSVGGGANRGSVWIPEVNDEVLVGFEGGDARQPVVIGGLFGTAQKMPQTAIKDGAVQTRAMTSRLGHVIGLLDGSSNAEQAIELVLAGKQHSIHLGKDKVTVKVPENVPVEVTSGTASIKISGSGDITMEANNITLNAKQAVKIQGAQISVEAKATLDMKAQAKAALSGGMLEMQAQGVAKVAGAMVEIN